MMPRKIFELADSKNENPLSTGRSISDLSYYQKSIYNIANYLLQKRIGKDDIVVSISTGSKEWQCVDLAVMSIGAIHITLSPTITTSQLNNILTETSPAQLFIQSGFVISILELCSCYKSKQIPFVVLKPSQDDHNIRLADLLNNRLTQQEVDTIENIKAAISERDTALISYTSGSGEKLKGVQHSHYSVTEQAEVISGLYNFNQVSCALSILPVNYMYERLFNYIYQFAKVPIVYADNNLSLAKNLLISKAGCCAMIPETLQLLLGSPNELELLKPTIQFMFCGGAPLRKGIVDDYKRYNIEIFEHYGSTETLIVALNSHRHFRPDTSGKIIFPERCKINEEGLLFYKSTFSGYFNSPELNLSKIDDNGFYQTEDLVEVDGDNFLLVKGRNSEIFKTKSGLFLNPVDIEKKVYQFCNTQYIVVYLADNLKPAAIVVPVPDQEDLSIISAIKAYNVTAKSDYVIERIKIVYAKWSEESGELTSSKKIKRSFVTKKYGQDDHRYPYITVSY